jgi:hypothetical protein
MVVSSWTGSVSLWSRSSQKAGCAGEFPLSEANRPVMRLLSRGRDRWAVSVLLRGERGSVASGG